MGEKVEADANCHTRCMKMIAHQIENKKDQIICVNKSALDVAFACDSIVNFVPNCLIIALLLSMTKVGFELVSPQNKTDCYPKV